MELMYFMLAVAACAAGLIWYVAKTLRHDAGARRANRSQHSHYPHQPRVHGHLSKHALHSHLHHTPPPVRDVWAEPKRRELAEAHGSYSLTARKIESDAEIEARRGTEDLSMPEIEYIPTELQSTSRSKR